MNDEIFPRGSMEFAGIAQLGHNSASKISLSAAWYVLWTLHGLYNTVPDTSSYGISNMNCTPGLGRPGINGSNGKMENELGESHSALQAAGGFGRDKHFPLDAWL